MPQKQKLLTFSSGGWVLLLAFLLSLLSAGLVLYPVYETGFHRAMGDGHNPETYGFDLSNLTIPRDQLIASGKIEDEVHAVPTVLAGSQMMTIREMELMVANEHIRFLVPSDPIIGVAIGGQSRAYSPRILNLHEVVNDTVGNVPIVITWSPLCGSAAVFQRPDAITEFGVSGLLFNSDLILFDRHSNLKDESLWSQLSYHAIAGPAVGKSLTLLPFQFTTWKEWSTAHPDTLIFRGLRSLKDSYNDAQDPYSLYLSTDEVRFPVSLHWPHPRPLLKTPLTLTTHDGGSHWIATFWDAPTTNPASTSSATQHAETPDELHLYSFLFAWYAQHPHDTDYSAIPQ